MFTEGKPVWRGGMQILGCRSTVLLKADLDLNVFENLCKTSGKIFLREPVKDYISMLQQITKRFLKLSLLRYCHDIVGSNLYRSKFISFFSKLLYPLLANFIFHKMMPGDYFDLIFSFKFKYWNPSNFSISILTPSLLLT